MAIYKQEKSGNWYIDFIDPNGKRVRQSAGTENKQQAQELHDRLKFEAWRVKNVGDKVRHSWQEAVVRWLNEHAHKKSLRGDKEVLRYLNQHLSDKWLDEITKSLVDNIKNHKLSTGVVNGTVNRVLALLRSILNAAKNEWEWIDAIPKIRILPEPVGRVRWLSIEELPIHIAAMARFALATGR